MNAEDGYPEDDTAVDDPRVLRAVQEYLATIEAGKKPDRTELLTRYPDVAGALTGCLDAVDFVHAVAPRLEEPTATGGATSPESPVVDLAVPLGDFHILREVGRGGMGVVYEAEQLSLGRRIALKVLPFALTLDPRQLQRFKNEAQAAAHLHHSHIAPIYSVGCERGVHFYAMQFIDGQSLAAVIRDLRKQDKETRRQGDKETKRTCEANGTQCGDQQVGADTLSPRLFVSSSAFFRTVAQWGVQVAEALEHAHQLGVIHRDIKPSNLMVDVRGELWVTDFGLARVQGETALTMTGDVVGTLRYMSPEQALAKRGLVDHRTDIYSLGATLYELLTLQPAFDGSDREELLRQITFSEPPPPRQRNQTIPADLETIVLKAMAREVEERYATAQDFADDLRRFLEHKPIKARRPTALERAVKWTRRHRPIVATAVALLAVAVVGLATGVVLLAREQAKTQAAYYQLVEEQARTKAAGEAEAEQRARAEESFREALQVVDFFAQVSEDELRDRPGLFELRRRLLEAALTYYRDFIEQRRDDPTLQAELTASQFRVAALLHEIGAKADAREALEQARLLEAHLLRDSRSPLAGGARGRGGPRPLSPLGLLPDSGVLHLLGQKSVQEELKLSTSEVRQVTELSRQRRELFLESRGSSTDQWRARLSDLAAREVALVEGLQPAQARRLKQVALQQRGPHALGDPDVADALKLSAEQKEKIRTIQDEARRSMGGPSPRGGPPRSNNRRPTEEPSKGLREQLLGVLTEAQKARWKEMTGEPFKGEVQPAFGGWVGPGRDFLPRRP